MLFKPGEIILSRGIGNLLKEKTFKEEDLSKLLKRHVNNDFGELSESDKELQLENYKKGIEDRVMSVYILNDIKIWIITEWNRSVTTILLPEEY